MSAIASFKQYVIYAMPVMAASLIVLSIFAAPLLGNKQTQAAGWKTVAQCQAEATSSSDDTYASRCINQQSVEGVVYRVYRTVLGRQTDRGGFNYWVKTANLAAKQGRDPVAVVIKGLMSSNEYRNKVMTGNTKVFVAETYVRTFGKKADAAGAKYWENQINAGKVSHQKFLATFAQSDRAKTTWSLEAPCYVTSYTAYCAD